MLPNICVPVKRDAWSEEVALPHKSPSIWNILSLLMRYEREKERDRQAGLTCRALSQEAMCEGEEVRTWGLPGTQQ